MAEGTRSLVSNNELMIYGVVDSMPGDVRAIDVVDSLAELRGSTITVRINSPGGSVTEGIAIYNALRADNRRVVIQVDAMAASIASVIAMSGDEIVMAENASIMIHDPWSFAIGSSGELRAMADEIDRMKAIIVDIYEKRTGMARAEIEMLMASETYMGAADAIERKFADRVVDDVRVAACDLLDRMALARILSAPLSNPAAEKPAARVNAAPAASQTEAIMPDTAPNTAGAIPTAASPELNIDAVRAEAATAERERISGIRMAVRAARLGDDVADGLISGGVTVDSAREHVLNAMIERNAREAGPEIVNVSVVRDETETRRIAVTEALSARLGVGGQVSDMARPFMEHSLVDIAAEVTGSRGRLSNAANRESVIRNAFHTTSDFPIILENSMNRALAARYALAQPTYRAISQQRSYMDFRDHISVRAGDFPQLQKVNESGEIKSGTFTESKEKTAVTAYGVRVGFSRQLLVNDSLGAIQQVLASRADAVARFEEETFWAMVLSASGAGPTLLETTRAVFNTTDKTLAASAAAVTSDAIAIGRAALRKMKTTDGTLINVTPTILVCGPDKETEAEKVLAPVLAAQTSNVNPFSGKLSLVVSAQITGNAWYLFVDPSVVANFEWGLLDGYSAPRMRLDEPFGTQGLNVSLEHDFGCGAVNYRGGYRNAGA